MYFIRTNFCPPCIWSSAWTRALLLASLINFFNFFIPTSCMGLWYFCHSVIVFRAKLMLLYVSCAEKERQPLRNKLLMSCLWRKRMNIVKLKEDVRESRRFQLDKESIKNVKRWRRCHIAKDVFIRRNSRSMLYINCGSVKIMINEV